MTKLTKAMLAADNAALRARVATLETQLKAERQLSVELSHENASLTARSPAKPRPTSATPQWQLDRRAAMEAAKLAARRTGKTVLAQF